MSRWIWRLVCLTLAVGLGLTAWAKGTVAPAPPQAEIARYLVLRQAVGGEDAAELHGSLAVNLLGRFGRAEVRELSEYAAGDAARFDAVVVLAPTVFADPPPQALLQDVRAADRPVIWMGPAQALFADARFAETTGLRTEAAPSRPQAVDYAGRRFPRDVRAPVLPERAVLRPGGPARVLAGTDAGEAWAVRSGPLLWVAEAPFAYVHEDDRYLVLADLLFEMLAPDTPVRRRALVRIEDVGPEADPTRIRAVADLLHAEGVPFSITVYDAYRDPGGRFHRGMSVSFGMRRRQAVAEALRYAESRGATLVAHGHTHQHDGRPNPYARVSGGDYEFFAADLDGEGAFALRGPLPNDRPEAWGARLDRSLAAWRDAGLGRPLIFTTPHYAASAAAYEAIRARYPIRYERVLYFTGETAGRIDYAGPMVDQFFPFETVDGRGDLIVPENLGYMSKETGEHFGRTPEALIASAERNLVVRDGFASFFHHWYEDPEALRTAVRGIKALGYRFVGPYEVARDAPAHAAAPRTAPAPEGRRAVAWVHALPYLQPDVLIGLLVLIGALWLAVEVILVRIGSALAEARAR